MRPCGGTGAAQHRARRGGTVRRNGPLESGSAGTRRSPMKRGSDVRWIWFLLALPAFAAGEEATVSGRVLDAETGKPVACTVAIRTSSGTLVTDHPSFREGFRSSGEFEKTVPVGETTVTVGRGFDYVSVEQRFVLRKGERRELTFELKR